MLLTIIPSNIIIPIIAPNENHTPFNFHATFLPFEIHSLSWALTFVYQVYMSAGLMIFVLVYYPLTLILMNNACWAVDSVVLQVQDLNLAGTSKSSRQSIDQKIKEVIEKTYYMVEMRSKVQKLLKFFFTTKFLVRPVLKFP